ncbi:MAG: DNA alkylation repair protein [bacterium]
MYYLYIVKCADGSFYTGITTDLARRIKEHNDSKKGAKYTSARRPVELVFSQQHQSRSMASKMECEVKKLSRTKKLQLILSKKTSKMEISKLQKEIRSLKDPAKAKVLAGFFKTGKGQYGYGDIFLGLTVPTIRQLVKKHQQMSLIEISDVMKSKFHEERLAAILLLVLKFQKGNEKTKKQIFDLYLENTAYVNNWDLVDSSGDKIVGAWLVGKSKDVLFSLACSKNLWERRIAMQATFHEIKLGQSKLAFSLAEKLLRDKEDLMHKVVGWMLREIGKRCSQKLLEEFLQKNKGKMSRTTLRYAIERFEQKKRLEYLK